jgi:hypothetical protein
VKNPADRVSNRRRRTVTVKWSEFVQQNRNFQVNRGRKSDSKNLRAINEYEESENENWENENGENIYGKNTNSDNQASEEFEKKKRNLCIKLFQNKFSLF